MEPYPVDTVVQYHGSLKHLHREYRITSHRDVRESRPDLSMYGDEQIAEWYPDGTAYMLWPTGVEASKANHHLYLTSVRRDSITPVDKPKKAKKT